MSAWREKWLVLFLLAALPLSVTAAPAPPLEELLAEQGYRLGAEVDNLPGFDLDQRVYLDSRHLLLPDADARPFVVTLAARCNGLYANPVVARTRKHSVLAPRDKLQPRHQGRNVDVCEVKSIHALEPL